MFRLLGLLGGLSIAMDMGTGAPLEESLRRCVVAARMADALDLSTDERRDVVYATLLEHLGCTAYTHELAQVFGDDVGAIRAAFLSVPSSPVDLVRTFVPLMADASGRSRARTLATALRSGRRVDTVGPVATCEVARASAAQLGLPRPVQVCLAHTTAMWDGSGHPSVEGESIPMATRLMQVASVATTFCLLTGPDRALRELRRRAGNQLDPALTELVDGTLLDDIGELDAYAAVLEAEPDPPRFVGDEDIEQVARTFGQLADLKSPFLQGHSAAVAELAAAAGRRLGLGPADVRTLRLAGHLHDLGRIGVSSRIWDKPTALSATERAQIELHPWHTEQILARVPPLAGVATVAAQHHERLDGSGYHRHAVAAQLDAPSRVLAAADRYRGLVEGRPHRASFTPAEARTALDADARCGRLDPDAVTAVLGAAGHLGGRRPTRPAGLTRRQVTVLRLVAAGRSNREIAAELVISPRTAEHHVQAVYAKIGVATRAGAALFAMEHGLLGAPGEDG